MARTLTVAIPTYNRNEILRRNLAHLLPQLDARCALLIVDNRSDVPVADTLAGMIAPDVPFGWEIVRNRANVGGDANQMRCFELCETDWIWVLGDDDEPLPDAVATVFATLEAYPEVQVANFSSELFARAADSVATGPTGILCAIDHFSNFLFISTNVYRTERIRSQLRIGHRYAFAMAPIQAALISGLADDSAVLFSHRRIVKWEIDPAAGQWSRVGQALAVMVLLDLKMTGEARRSLARNIRRFIPTANALANELRNLQRLGQIDDSTRLHLSEQIIFRCFHPQATFMEGVKLRLLWLSLRSKPLHFLLTRSKQLLSGRRAAADGPADNPFNNARI